MPHPVFAALGGCPSLRCCHSFGQFRQSLSQLPQRPWVLHQQTRCSLSQSSLRSTVPTSDACVTASWGVDGAVNILEIHPVSLLVHSRFSSLAQHNEKLCRLRGYCLLTGQPLWSLKGHLESCYSEGWSYSCKRPVKPCRLRSQHSSRLWAQWTDLLQPIIVQCSQQLFLRDVLEANFLDQAYQLLVDLLGCGARLRPLGPLLYNCEKHMFLYSIAALSDVYLSWMRCHVGASITWFMEFILFLTNLRDQQECLLEDKQRSRACDH